MPDFSIGVTDAQAEQVKKAVAFAQRESDDLDDAILQNVREAAADALDTGVIELSRGELEELSEALADYSIDVLDGPTPSSFDDVTTRVFRYVEHGQDYDPEKDSALSVTEEEEGEEPSTTTIEFGSWEVADEVRDEYEKHLADADDRRYKEVVIHTGGLTRAEMDAIKADAAEGRAVDEQSSTSVPLTEDERERIKDLGGFDRTTTTKSWESAKGVFAREGVQERFHDAMGALTDGDDPAEQAEQWVRNLKSEGADRSGGARDVGEEDEQQKRKEQKAAARVQEEGCNHAREECRNGKPEACEHLKNVCGMDEEAVDALLSDGRAPVEQTEQEELVTVGGEEYPEMEVTPQEAGALRDSWTGYKSAVSELSDALDTIREETTNARRSISAINAIREAHDQEEIHPDRLHDLMDAVGDMPEAMPEVRTLAHYGAFGDADAAATADVDRLGAPDSDVWNYTGDGYRASGADGQRINIEDTGRPGNYHVQVAGQSGHSVTIATNLPRPDAEELANLLASNVRAEVIDRGGDLLTRSVRGAVASADPVIKDALVDRFAPRSPRLDADVTDVDTDAGSAGSTPLDFDAAPVRRREGDVPEEINGWGYNGTETVTFEDPDRGGEITVEAWQWYCPTNDRAVGLAGPVERYAAEGYPYVVLDRFRDTDDNIRWRLRYIAEDWNAALTEVGRQIERRENKGLDDVDRPSPPLDVDTTAVDARQHRRAQQMRDRHRHRQVEAKAALDEYDPEDRRRIKRGIAPKDEHDDAAGIIPGRTEHRREDRDRPERIEDFREVVAQDDRRLKPDPRLRGDVSKVNTGRFHQPATPDKELDPVQEDVKDSLFNAVRRGKRHLAVDAVEYGLNARSPEEIRDAILVANWVLGVEDRFDPEALIAEAQKARRRDPPIDGDAMLHVDGEPLRRDRGDAVDGRGQFANDVQGTLGSGVESEQTAEEKQVTLTGADEGDSNRALPAGWTREGSTWVAGPLKVQMDSHDGSEWHLRLYTPDGNEEIASGLDSPTIAEQVAEEFTDAVAPDEVSVHNADGTVMEASAAAKKRALEGRTGPLDQFRGGSGNPNRPVDVVMTAIGGSGVSDAIEQSDALLGYEASRTEPPSGSVEFVDFPFTSDKTNDRRIEMLKEAVERHQPKIAVAPDIEGAVDVEDAAAVGDDLLRLGADHVVMVPKDVPPTEVPDRFRVGFPAADFGSDAGHFITDYADFDGDGIHVLGASPTVQLDLASYGLDVESVDGSSVMVGAENHDIWTPDSPHWEGVTGRSDLYDRLRTSLNNVVAAWKQRHGQDAHIVDSNEFDERIEEQAEEATREVRRRRAGRGPPVADPDTGEIQREDGTPVEEGATQPEEIDTADLNQHDREMIRAIERGVEQEREDGDSSDDSDDSDGEEPDDHQLRLRT